MPPDSTSPSRQVRRVLNQTSTAWAVLGVSLILTIIFWQFSAHAFTKRGQDRFLFRIEKETVTLVARMRAYEQVLLGARALFAASDEVTRKDWHAYVEGLAIDEKLPGIQGTGFAEIVRTEDMTQYLQAIRAQGFPHYDIEPPGNRALYTPIAYLEPVDERNQRAFGYDMYSDPVRREAMERARDTGSAALTGKVTLVQETQDDVQPGFLIYLPVYHNRMPQDSVAQRRAALLGFVYSPFRAHDLMRGIFGAWDEDTEIELFDGTPVPANLLFSTSQKVRKARHNVDKRIEIGGREWTLRFHSRPEYEIATTSVQPWIILFGGTALNLLLFAVMFSNARHVKRMDAAALTLAQSRDRYLNLVDNVPGTVFRSEPKPTWHFHHLSPSVGALAGEAADAFLEGRVAYARFIHPDDIAGVKTSIGAALRAGTPYEVEYRIRQQNGRLRWVNERGRTSYDEAGEAQWIDGVIIDVTERKLAETAIRALAFYDPLTHLPNRRLLDDRLRHALVASERSRCCGAVLFIDLDNFKPLNDNHGHEVGDMMLCEVAQRLRDAVRESDTVARLGGDEFVVMIENLGMDCSEATAKACQVANKILIALNHEYRLGEHVHCSTPSIGLTTFCGQGRGAGQLIREADHAMYRAKEAGRNTVRVFEYDPTAAGDESSGKRCAPLGQTSGSDDTAPKGPQ
ncbi:GGDEF domain-containing protein [Parazoarcus communis]|uniref:GGDEF domain-containing protein n=1 Tax=Parazoarcus communis TaxID=41977 RepID=A0A2U8H5P7_9RHOO|nr:GGDEF domain-containing protein [Parazoarcus communis]AWI80850.1 GGDEF domain-containing protein [Parazoarcus communis]